MPTKQKSPPKLTDTERHARFKDMAREVEASEDPKDFEKALNLISPAPAKRAERG